MDGVDDPVAAFHDRFDWRRALREHRAQRRLSQADVGRRAALSVASVRAYENGSRHPTPEALSAMIEAIGLTPEQAGPVRAGAGYTVDLEWLIGRRYAPRQLDELATEAERYAWPVWVANITGDLLVMNRAFRTMLGVELMSELGREEGPPNYIAAASNPLFADRVENWDEVVRFLIGLSKGEPRASLNLERPQPFLEQAVQRFLRGDPAYVRRLMMLWNEAPDVPTGTRYHCPFRWKATDGRVMRLTCVLHIADIWSELLWGDYVPEDAATWEILSGLPRVV
jgi:transcriptional regulator with XRE-family HTH domain